MIYHVLPVGDLHEHSNNVDEPCPCNPKVQEVDGDMVLVHNAWDLREVVEEAQAILKPKEK